MFETTNQYMYIYLNIYMNWWFLMVIGSLSVEQIWVK
jgi:hypothetical protein